MDKKIIKSGAIRQYLHFYLMSDKNIPKMFGLAGCP